MVSVAQMILMLKAHYIDDEVHLNSVALQIVAIGTKQTRKEMKKLLNWDSGK